MTTRNRTYKIRTDLGNTHITPPECDNRQEDGCRNRASYLISVPWTNVFTGDKGSTWTPFCGACATELDEDWAIQENN